MFGSRTMEELVNEGKRFCVCGCGTLINAFDKKHRPRKWIPGHYHRKTREKIPCACGCGIIIDAVDEHGHTKTYKHGHNRKGMLPEENSQWKGGRVINDHGYIEIRSVGHRRAHKPGYYVGEHVLVMEQHLNACLCDWTIVHHINEIKTDNRIENLQMMTASQHTAHHVRKRGVPPRVGNRWARLV